MKSTAAFGLLSLLLTMSLTIPTVEATGSNRASIIYSSQWLLLPADREQMYWACVDITNLFLGWNTIAEYYYDHVKNRHAQITWTLVKSMITHCEYYHTFATVLYIGHGGVVNYGYIRRYSIYEQAAHNNPNNAPSKIFDVNIYHAPTVEKHRFVFLWACFQGNEPGYHDTLFGPFGMAFSWTRKPNLSQDGYNSPDSRPYCFIGFALASPRLSETVKESTNNLYKHWLVFFYYHALNGYSIKNALDRASQNVGYPRGWLATPLRNGFRTYFPPEFLPPGINRTQDDRYSGWMKIYGNANINLLWG